MASQPSRRYRGPAMRPTQRGGVRVPPRVLRAFGVPRVKRSNLRPFLIGFAVLCVLVPTVVLAAGGVFYNNTTKSLAGRLDKLKTYRPFLPSYIYSRDGQLLYELVDQGRREPVSLNQISPLLINATVSTEDKTFFENRGIDPLGIARAAYQTVTRQGSSGASTITQQFIKLVILDDDERSADKVASRKLTEIILAQELTKLKSKEEILALYLNEINYGNLSYGIQAAAKNYFGKTAKDLSLNEASLLAGLPQQPSKYTPVNFVTSIDSTNDADRTLPGITLKPGWLNPQFQLPYGTPAPRLRQVEVLRNMVLNGAVTKVNEKDAIRAAAEPLILVRQVVPLKAPHFVFYIKEQLDKDPAMRELLKEGGLRITTTLDLRVQDVAQEEARKRIEELNQEQRNIHNAAVVVLQPGTGQILAMVGSIDYNKSERTTTAGEEGNVLDGNVNVTTALRQPGSALKPFTYLSALEQRKLDAGSILWDIETRFPVKVGATDKNIKKCLPDSDSFWYCPFNFDRKWHGPLRMREALANSLNMPAVKALKTGGVPQAIDLLHRVGITSLNDDPNRYGLALTLGGGEVTPLDLTTAYNTLANGGQYIPTTPIIDIRDRDNKQLQLASVGQARRAVDEKYVAVVRDFMGDNEARKPIFGISNTLVLSRPAHAKTGTTEDFRDAWAVGYTPYVTVGVWTGNNNNEKTAKVESVTGGGVIYHRIMERLFTSTDLDKLLRGNDLHVALDFPNPKDLGLQERKICQLGGAFGQRKTEWFVPSDTKNDSGTATANGNGDDCDLFKPVQAVRDPAGGYCAPIKGVSYGERLVTFRVPNLPKSEDDAKIIGDAKWESASSDAVVGVAPTRPCGANVANAPNLQPEPDNKAPNVQPAANSSQPVSQPTARPTSASRPTSVAVRPSSAPLPTAIGDKPAPGNPHNPQPTDPSNPNPGDPGNPPPAPGRPPTAKPQPTDPPAQPTDPPVQPTPRPRPTQPPPPEPTDPPRVARIPSLVGLGEDQAKGVLANLGITDVVVDYQGRDRLGDVFDKYGPYVVVSHSPGPGTPVTPGMSIILGVRAPE